MLTDSDEEMLDDEKKIYDIKRNIKETLKKHSTPESNIRWWDFGRLLGRGAYGKINLCKQVLSNRICAVKSINFGSHKIAINRITTEKEILKACRHPNIVKLYECISD